MENCIDLSANEEIERFIQSSYSDGYQTALNNAIALLYLYEMPNIQEHLCGIIYAPESEDPDVAHQDFSGYVESSVYALLEQHDVYLNDAPLLLLNEVMAALYRIQRVEDPIPYLRILETNTLSNEEKLAKILSSLSAAKEEDIFAHLNEVTSPLLARLTAVLTKLEEEDTAMAEVEIDESKKKLIDNLKLYFKHFGQENLAHHIVAAGMQIGLPLKFYLAYFEDHLVEGHPDEMAVDLLGFFYLAEDSWQRPIDAYREISETIIHTPSELIKVETKLRQLSEVFTQFVKAQHDAHSVPAV